MTLVDLDFILCCGDTGATEAIHWTGSTQNPGDKAISAAVTVAEKYFLKATFIISTGDVADDPDSGIDEEEPAKSSGVSKRQPPKPKGEAQPQQEAAKSPVIQPIQDSADSGHVDQPANGGDSVPTSVDMPDDLFQKLMKDKDISAAGKVGQERAATIRKLWAEGKITADMDEYDRVLAVIDRLNSHRKGGAS